MSTKTTLKHRMPEPGKPSFHLFEDCLDRWLEEDQEDCPVYLSIDGIQAEMSVSEAGARVELTLPRELARELGLIPRG